MHSPPTASYASIDDCPQPAAKTTTGTEQPPAMLALAFWLLGLLNNAAYIIMIASAKTISEGGTALVFLANVLPAMCVKLSAPYWFDHVSYYHRILIAFWTMVLSFGMVASGTSVGVQLLGVALCSVHTGLGESSLLAAAGKCDASGRCIGAFSSGTGLAGVFGFFWKFIWNEWMNLSMRTTLWLAQSLSLLYIYIYWKMLHPYLKKSVKAATPGAGELMPLEMNTFPPVSVAKTINGSMHATEKTEVDSMDSSSGKLRDTSALRCRQPDDSALESPPEIIVYQAPDVEEAPKPVSQWTTAERSEFVVKQLWPYIIPLFVVYATEYSLQAGTWTAIGFPVESQQARNEFYEYSNWMYQAGVFISRSSGAFGPAAPMSVLWIMPTLQALNVVFFAFVAADHVFYSYAMLLPCCFYVGLLGGGVYVHGYKRICADFDIVDRREFALATTSVAESFGIVCADVMGLFIQACLYQSNDIAGAIVSCPI
ncbi:Protein BTN1 [Seminavis robusta]|uniref:Protein BTN1 n=1 Tax=Seminavis robusta TaxID=568900 RepID=A0A9N8HPC2_9STRA|nr:Protein BTN1 [Seminavis robusta]|eukprot:Sro1072_g238130.1 Protein BTN1 (484) ;mRNA; f:33055-34506